MERTRPIAAGVACAADGTDADGIHRVGFKSVDIEGGVGEIVYAVANGELPCRLAAAPCPVDGGAVGGDVAEPDIAHTAAHRLVADGDVVDGGSPIGQRGSVGTDGDILPVAVVVLERDFIPVPYANGGVDEDGVDRLEGVDVVRVGHHAHNEHRVVIAGRRPRPEVEIQCVDGVCIDIYRRQDDGLVVAEIGACRDTEAQSPVARVGAGRDDGVGVLEGDIVEMVPAMYIGRH